MKQIAGLVFWMWLIGLLVYGCTTKDYVAGTVWPYAAVKKLDDNHKVYDNRSQ